MHFVAEHLDLDPRSHSRRHLPAPASKALAPDGTAGYGRYRHKEYSYRPTFLPAALAFLLLLTGCKREEVAKALPPPVVLVVSAVQRDVPVYREWIGTLDGSENAQIRARV